MNNFTAAPEVPDMVARVDIFDRFGRYIEFSVYSDATTHPEVRNMIADHMPEYRERRVQARLVQEVPAGSHFIAYKQTGA